MSHIRSGFCGVNVPIGSDASSKTTNTINNNVIINKKDEKPYDGDNVKEVSDGVYVVYPDTQPEYQERDLKSAQERLNQIKATQPDNDKLIQALSLIIDILYNNPTYINKWVISEGETLKELVKLLTSADEVSITTTDPSCDCGGCGNKNKLIQTIDSIYVRIGEDVREFRYCYPGAKQILENSHISTRLIMSSA